MISARIHSTLLLLIATQFILSGVHVTGTTFTFVNKCDSTVWPGILAGSTSPKLDSTGFELPKGGTRVFATPSGWSGRFWARTGCNFDSTGTFSCATADCGSNQIECNGAGAAPPATLAEFTLNGSGGQDFYDVSLVDGYNLPMIIEASGGTGGCDTTGCLVDLNERCPAELQSAGGGACKSACEAFGRPEYCCSGEYGSPDTCKPSTYSELFKNACPRAYSYAYDDASSTFTCAGAEYTITFCPSTPSQKSSLNPSPGTTAVTGVSGSSTDSGSTPQVSSGSPAMNADGSWLAKLATGNSLHARHPTIGLQLAMLVIVMFSLATSLFNL